MRGREVDGRCGRSGLLLGLALLVVQVALADPGDPADERVRVLYPRGACATGVIEIEVFERGTGVWQPHPVHWRIPADTCQEEVAGVLLQEIRYRCVDPEAPSRVSAWILGVDVFDSISADRCAAEMTKD